ncbi:MAG: HugZ family pyridoxamine 5'-phosphate oxidase [Caulobacteraceae bacterium]
MPAEFDPRALMHAQATAALGTLMDGAPYVSLVLVAFDADGSPLLLLSRLAQHTRNLLAAPHVSLLFDGTAGLEDPLAGPRLTVLGQVAPCPDPAALERYVARHPSAATYAGFTDFGLYKVRIDRAHLVAGFGKIAWIEAETLLGPA